MIFVDESTPLSIGDIITVRKISWALSEFDFSEYKIYLSGIDFDFSNGFGSNAATVFKSNTTGEPLHIMILDFCEVPVNSTRLKFKTLDESTSIFVKVLIVENASTAWIAMRILLGDMSR